MVNKISMKYWAKKLMHKFGIDVRRYPSNNDGQVVNLRPDGKCYGSALLALIIDPFLLSKGEKVSSAHTMHKESLEIAKVFLELGYEVDVIYRLRRHFVPEKSYTFYVNFRTNFHGVGVQLNDDCIRIVHLDVCHWLFSNYSAVSRMLALQERRGVALASTRYIKPNYAIENCDYATTMGNDFTIGTYQYAKKDIYRTKIPTYRTYDWARKSISQSRKNFLWFGSSGFVHKGLDLVLETFAALPTHNLTVCGPIDKDPEFRNEYYKELFETPNIVTKGWIDIDSQEFIDVASNHIAVVFPSCAEAFNGGVTTCMQAGIIPIVSVETSIDIDPSYGFLLKDSTIEEIRETVTIVSELSATELLNLTRNAWEYANKNHTLDNCHQSYKNAILDIVRKENKRRSTQIVVSS